MNETTTETGGATMARYDFDRLALMGILNLTPDSFSDGGCYADTGKALERAVAMADEGADIIDIGGESTRPGSQRVSADEQKQRVLEVVGMVASALPGRLISIDTTRAEVAEAALDAGAGMINDVSAGRDDPAMFELAAARGVPVCLMHIQGEPATMQDAPRYDDVVSQVGGFLRERMEAACASGISEERIVLDPGIGFGKTLEHNLTLLANLSQIVAIGRPVLLGASRKRFIAGVDGTGDAALAGRVGGGCAATVLGFLAGVSIFRVHDVAAHRQALDVARAVRAHAR